MNDGKNIALWILSVSLIFLMLFVLETFLHVPDL